MTYLQLQLWNLYHFLDSKNLCSLVYTGVIYIVSRTLFWSHLTFKIEFASFFIIKWCELLYHFFIHQYFVMILRNIEEDGTFTILWYLHNLSFTSLLEGWMYPRKAELGQNIQWSMQMYDILKMSWSVMNVSKNEILEAKKVVQLSL